MRSTPKRLQFVKEMQAILNNCWWWATLWLVSGSTCRRCSAVCRLAGKHTSSGFITPITTTGISGSGGCWRDGSRPDAIAIVMAAMNWNASGIRGDYSSQYLFRSADIPAVQSQLGLDRSTASGLLLSRFSKAYALRGEVRKIILNQIIPDLPRMYALFQPGPARHIPDERVVEVASRRMASYKDVAAAYGIPIIAVVPPITPPNEEYHSALRTAASRAGIQIAIPTEARNLPPSDFADDIHLSKRGASVFTEQLGKVLGGNLTSAAATPGNIEAAVPARP